MSLQNTRPASLLPCCRGWTRYLALIVLLLGPAGVHHAFAQATPNATQPSQQNPPPGGTPSPEQGKPTDNNKKKAQPKKKPAQPAKAGAAKKPDASADQPGAKAGAAPSTAAAPAPLQPADAAALAKAQAQVERLSGLSVTLIQLLVQQGVITREKAEEMMQQAQLGPLPPTEVVPRTPPVAAAAGAAGAAAAAAAATQLPEVPPSDLSAAKEDEVRVPYVPEIVKNEIRDQVRDEVLTQAKAERWGDPGAFPEWLNRIGFDGDLRFRFQENLYSPGNTPAPTYNAITGSNLSNTTQDESRFFVRARLGINATIADPLFARLSITTGDGLNPVNLNQNLANYSSGLSLQLTDAYLRYTPGEWAVGWVGQFPKPFVSTDMLYWDDLVFDGIAASFNRPLNSSTAGFTTLGAFLIQNTASNASTPDPKTKALFGVQVGGNYNPSPATRFNVAMAYYDFNNIQGIPNPSVGSQVNDWTAPLFRQKGNSVFNINSISNPNTILYGLAPEYRIFDLNGSVDLAQLDPYVVKIGGDFVKNLGFSQSEILARTGLDISPETIGYQISLMAGKPDLRRLNDWQAFFIYRHLERDAVVDAFNDPEFYLGGTNYKGYQLGLRYGLGANVWLRARWMSADQISGPPLAIDVFQFDLNARF
jgi:Putative porin